MNYLELDNYLKDIGFNHINYSKNYKLEVPTSSLKGVDAVTDILVDEYNETENFIKDIFNRTKTEWL
tara:strand:+ start:400 stop:600 length:201 start_codon:yes stop_codon:yes gene_type:complete